MSAVERAILAECAERPASTAELLRALGYRLRTGNFKKALSRLLERGVLVMTKPEKPRTRTQRYRLTESGREYQKKYNEAK